MTGDHQAETDPVRIAVLECMVADQQGAGLGRLGRYLQMFAGYETIVREEYERLTRDADADPDEDGAADDEGPGEVFDVVATDGIFEAFEKLDTLGRGGQGIVFLAREKSLNRLVALKILSNLTAFDGQMLARFLREGELASTLQHPGICTVYSSGVDQGVPYIAMQYVDGPNLEDVIAAWQRVETDALPEALREPPTTRGGLDAVVQLLEATARALQAAHAGGVLHRDIKPSNLMVDAAGQPVLMDFGLARSTEHGHTMTLSGTTLGTPAYLPPEQLLPGFEHPDERCDVYSLGVTMYEALTLQHPFATTTRDQLYRAILAGNPTDPQRLNPLVGRDLAVVVQTAMDKDPNRRYASAEALAEDLRRVREHHPIAARPAGPMLRLRRWFERSPALASSLLVLVFGLIGWAVSLSFALDETANQRDRADRRTAEYEQLAAARKVTELRAADSALWHLSDAGAARMRAWLDDAQRLVARLPELRRSLAAMREKAREPRDEAERRRFSPLRSRYVDLDLLVETVARVRDELAAADDPPMRADLRRVETRLEKLRTELAAVEVSVFDDPKDAWRHEKLVGLIRDLETIQEDEKGFACLPVIQRRWQLARDVGRVTIDEQAAAWRRVAAELREDERFAGVAVDPVPGLIPLGPDPESGLQEFALYGSGTVPVREGGVLRLTDDMAAVLVLVPGGKTTLGPRAGDAHARGNEPKWSAHLVPYLIGKFEVTQAQWELLMSVNLSTYRAGVPQEIGRAQIVITPRHPVENVDWKTAFEFVSRLGCRFPSEAQWEHAAWGGGDKTHLYGSLADLEGKENLRGREYEEINTGAPTAAWSDRHPVHAPVGALSGRNGFGLADVVGNVAEFCQDAYDELPRDRAAPGDGLGVLGNAELCVYRGGSWYFTEPMCRVAVRNYYSKSQQGAHLGIRLARPWPGK